MTEVPVTSVDVTPGSRLDDLLATYDLVKAAADEAETRLNLVKDAIKAELSAAAPGAQKVNVAHAGLAQPLRLSYVESWRVDAKKLRAEAPETYVRYAVKGGCWELRAASA